MLSGMNNSIRRLIAGLLIGVMLSSCAYQSQVIHLNPAPFKADAVAATDHEVILITHDARSSQEIGHRSNGSRDPNPSAIPIKLSKNAEYS